MTTPVPTRVKLSAPGGILVTWSDGHQATYPHAYLRKHCPCATCEEHPPDVVDDSPASLPVLGQRPVRAISATPIGHYAIQFNWNDGHQAGIYSFDYLREICPCKACLQADQ